MSTFQFEIRFVSMPNLSPVCYINDYVFIWKLSNNANLCLKLTVTIRIKLQNQMLLNSLLIEISIENFSIILTKH